MGEEAYEENINRHFERSTYSSAHADDLVLGRWMNVEQWLDAYKRPG